MSLESAKLTPEGTGRQMGKAGVQALHKHWNWKGGRTISSHGYVKLKMPDHPNATSNGYVYEHQLIAEQLLGRHLHPGEIVHHRDGNGQNNDPENICVTVSREYHKLAHRKPGSRLRLPVDANPTIECGCGCGGTLTKYDEYNRSRAHINGHYHRSCPTRNIVLARLAEGPTRTGELVALSQMTSGLVHDVLNELKDTGVVTKLARGLWALQEDKTP